MSFSVGSARPGHWHWDMPASAHSSADSENKLDVKSGQSGSGGRLTWRCHALSLTECVCNYLGTVREDCEGSESCRCEAATGQCRCLPNVVGLTCDRCAPHTWRLASGTGCEQCDCDPARSLGPACNEVRERGHGPEAWPLLWCRVELLRSPHLLMGLFFGFGSSQGSATACRVLEAGPAGSARSSSGVTQVWSA